MRNQIVLATIGGDADAPGLFRRAFRRLRLRLRLTTNLERAAARNRAERLFEVNFRSPWTR
ncbi:MAG: hypothetical protein ABSE62_02820 [Chthoniobacteraceae bacterium]|jgi:hypothetical protein